MQSIYKREIYDCPSPSEFVHNNDYEWKAFNKDGSLNEDWWYENGYLDGGGYNWGGVDFSSLGFNPYDINLSFIMLGEKTLLPGVDVLNLIIIDENDNVLYVDLDSYDESIYRINSKQWKRHRHSIDYVKRRGKRLGYHRGDLNPAIVTVGAKYDAAWLEDPCMSYLLTVTCTAPYLFPVKADVTKLSRIDAYFAPRNYNNESRRMDPMMMSHDAYHAHANAEIDGEPMLFSFSILPRSIFGEF